jgi:hypothetical protein
VEILRAALVDDELCVTARHAFKDPADWGEVLADITRRLALLYSMETDLSEAEALTEIEEAYAAEMGAREVPEPEQQPAVASSAEGAPRAPKRKAASAAKPRPKRPVPPPSESEG